MPITPLHKKKLFKNLAVLAAIIVFMLIVYAITVVRLSQGMNAAAM